ncbi:S1 domain protein, partial [Vibrio parahaemolyticus EKP-008]
LLRPLTSQSLK